MTAQGQLPLPGLSARRERGIAPSPPGAERLFAALVMRGLRDDHYVEAAALVLALEVEASNGQRRLDSADAA